MDTFSLFAGMNFPSKFNAKLEVDNMKQQDADDDLRGGLNFRFVYARRLHENFGVGAGIAAELPREAKTASKMEFNFLTPSIILKGQYLIPSVPLQIYTLGSFGYGFFFTNDLPNVSQLKQMGAKFEGKGGISFGFDVGVMMSMGLTANLGFHANSGSLLISDSRDKMELFIDNGRFALTVGYSL